MSILIKSMKMPIVCPACPFFKRGDLKCVLTGNTFDLHEEIDRKQDCPLVEIPPHGRLIDADALEEYWKPDHNRYFDADYFIHTIESAPTIITAEASD